jgi:hypothetical protein
MLKQLAVKAKELELNDGRVIKIIINSLSTWDKDVFTEEDIKAIIAKDILNLAKEKNNIKIIGKIDEFVELFFEYFNETFKGNIRKLKDQEKNIDLAYNRYKSSVYKDC